VTVGAVRWGVLSGSSLPLARLSLRGGNWFETNWFNSKKIYALKLPGFRRLSEKMVKTPIVQMGIGKPSDGVGTADRR
jgi:hypothetical protein